eukprot:6205966-Pleurochrysis_carterae.AAC.3
MSAEASGLVAARFLGQTPDIDQSAGAVSILVRICLYTNLHILLAVPDRHETSLGVAAKCAHVICMQVYTSMTMASGHSKSNLRRDTDMAECTALASAYCLIALKLQASIGRIENVSRCLRETCEHPSQRVRG